MKRGRVTVAFEASSLNRPHWHFAAEQPPGREEWGYAGLSYGNGNSDPVALIEIDLGGTRIGHLIFVVYWTVGDWLDRRKAKAQQ